MQGSKLLLIFYRRFGEVEKQQNSQVKKNIKPYKFHLRGNIYLTSRQTVKVYLFLIQAIAYIRFGNITN